MKVISRANYAWENERELSWHLSFLRLAEFWANQRSKDPSTKIGAVLVRGDRTIVSLGYNGFPRGYPDRPNMLNDRELKYPRIVHAEMNALATAREPITADHILYSTLLPCSDCFKNLIQFGVRNVYSWKPNEADDAVHTRWNTSHRITQDLAEDCGVQITVIGRELLDLGIHGGARETV